jgi:hypothetical protein
VYGHGTKLQLRKVWKAFGEELGAKRFLWHEERGCKAVRLPFEILPTVDIKKVFARSERVEEQMTKFMRHGKTDPGCSRVLRFLDY